MPALLGTLRNPLIEITLKIFSLFHIDPTCVTRPHCANCTSARWPCKPVLLRPVVACSGKKLPPTTLHHVALPHVTLRHVTLPSVAPSLGRYYNTRPNPLRNLSKNFLRSLKNFFFPLECLVTPFRRPLVHYSNWQRRMMGFQGMGRSRGRLNGTRGGVIPGVRGLGVRQRAQRSRAALRRVPRSGRPRNHRKS